MERPFERTKRKFLKENLWISVLGVLEESDMYGIEIREELRKRFGFWIGNVTSYKVLYYLENGGYVKSYEKGRKKYYKATRKGVGELRAAKKFFQEI